MPKLIEVKKAKNGSGNLYNGIYSRYGYKCFECAFNNDKLISDVVYCTVNYTDDFEIPKTCIIGRRIFRECRS